MGPGGPVRRPLLESGHRSGERRSESRSVSEPAGCACADHTGSKDVGWSDLSVKKKREMWLMAEKEHTVWIVFFTVYLS